MDNEELVSTLWLIITKQISDDKTTDDRMSAARNKQMSWGTHAQCSPGNLRQPAYVGYQHADMIILKRDIEILLVSLAEYRVTLSVCGAHTLIRGEFLDQNSKHQLLNVSSHTVKTKTSQRKRRVRTSTVREHSNRNQWRHNWRPVSSSYSWAPTGAYGQTAACVLVFYDVTSWGTLCVNSLLDPCVGGEGHSFPLSRVLSLLHTRSAYYIRPGPGISTKIK